MVFGCSDFLFFILSRQQVHKRRNRFSFVRFFFFLIDEEREKERKKERKKDP